jgi:hypothetical protein
MNKEIALSELEAVRTQLPGMVNGRIDSLIAKIKNGEAVDNNTLSAAEIVYPLSIDPAFFKGTKPTAVYFGNEKVPVKTWRKAYTLILQRCVGIPEKREALMGLRNKINGRTRTILSDKPNGMNRPVEIADEVFIESFFDTEWLVRILTREILEVVRYDYSGISVSVVKSKRGGSRYL